MQVIEQPHVNKKHLSFPLRLKVSLAGGVLLLFIPLTDFLLLLFIQF